LDKLIEIDPVAGEERAYIKKHLLKSADVPMGLHIQANDIAKSALEEVVYSSDDDPARPDASSWIYNYGLIQIRRKGHKVQELTAVLRDGKSALVREGDIFEIYSDDLAAPYGGIKVRFLADEVPNMPFTEDPECKMETVQFGTVEPKV